VAKLTAAGIRKLKPAARAVKHYDGEGLYLEVPPTGRWRWRFRYRWQGKQQLLSLGLYPAVSLSDAREKGRELQQQLRDGIDPSAHRKATNRTTTAPDTFAAVAREWFEAVHIKRVVEAHSARNWRRVEVYLLPTFGRCPIGEIDPPELLALLRTIEASGKTETARRVKTLASHIFRYAIATGRATRDPSTDITGLLAQNKAKHHAAIVDPAELGRLLDTIDHYQGNFGTVEALQLSALLFVRPGELRRMAWADIDTEAATWRYHPSKNGLPLVTPLPRQAIAILDRLQPVTGNGFYVFPSGRDPKRPLSENTLNAALHRMGYKGVMVAHGFRATARTILVEHCNANPEWVEMQLGHRVRTANGRAYDRTTFLQQRRDMLQQWADYLDQLRQA